MGYIIGLYFVGQIVGVVILLLYGLVTDPINTLVIIAGFVIFIVLAFIAIVLFFQIKRFLFFLLHHWGYVDGDWQEDWHWRHRRK
ncbi:hypothetical protein [uncultured Selenomonas sp.]|uniref:hypothetical protein n=1 Tax=uncultured Selenomonas sp. TaxID=159275 RepID=UPI0028DC3536|nr:hypothetical protein [uncultured Selenomonas sp.]